MTLRQLSYALTIAELGSVTAAAERLHLSQPSLSQQLRALEREVGVDLFVRGNRGLVPTEAGRRFLVEARVAVDAARRARTAAQACDGQITGNLVVAVERSHALALLPAALRQLRSIHPDLRIEVLEAEDCAELQRLVRDGIADLAVGGMNPSPGLDFQSLGEEVFVVVLPPGDLLLERSTVPMGALAGHPWVRHTGGCVEQALFDQAMGRLNTGVDTVAKASQASAAVALAAAGIGVTLVPAGVVPVEASHLARPLEPPLSRAVQVATRSPAGPASDAMVAALVEHAAPSPETHPDAVGLAG